MRNRRYLYGNTRLADHGFSYLAEPKALLRGYLIAAAFLLLFTLGDQINPILSLAALGCFYLLLPWLIYKSLRFRAHNTAWRNLRFRFTGTLGQSYVTFLLIPALLALPPMVLGALLPILGDPSNPDPIILLFFFLLMALSAGAIVPMMAWKKRHYFFAHMAFGTTGNDFTGQKGYFYRLYVKAFFILLAMVTLISILVSILLGMTPLFAQEPTKLAELFPLFVFLPFFAAQIFLIMYLYARENNYCWIQSQLGPARFDSTLKAWDLTWIRLTNILAIISSLGLLIPWAKVRRLRYQLANLRIYATDLDGFVGRIEQDEGALGEAALDTFDFEVGF